MNPIYLASGEAITIQANSTIASITPGQPYVVQTTAAHGLSTGALVQLSCMAGAIFTATVINSTSFSLNETASGGAIFTPASGTVQHVGQATTPVATDGTQIPSGTSFAYHFTFNSLTGTGTARGQFEDADQTNFTDARPGPSFCTTPGPITNQSPESYSATSSQWPGMRVSSTGDTMRAKVFVSGGPGTAINFTAFLQ